MDRGIEQHHIRIIDCGGIVVLDAHPVGDWCIQFHIGILFNPSGPLLGHYLAQQRHNFCALIKVFGPNQFVLVANPGDPFPPMGTDLFSPQTLHGCLELTYGCRAVNIHRVPESSGAQLWGHNQSGALICRGAEWTEATFHDNRVWLREFHHVHINLPMDIYGQYLFNGQPYSKRFQGGPYAKHIHPGQGD
jgi:hypothetical protein